MGKGRGVVVDQAGVLAEAPTALDVARSAFGHGAAVWARRDHIVEDGWWLALSGTSGSDYNQGLLYGEPARERLPDILGRIEAAGCPALLSLAGAGLSSAQQLSDAGWVCVAALPFMYRAARPGKADRRVRPLVEGDLLAARALLSSTFEVAPDSAGALFRADLLQRETARAWGLFDPGLVSVAVTVEVGDLYVGWALATAPEHQQHRYGSSLLRHIDQWYYEHGAPGSLHVATAAGTRLYAARGHTTLEHWQLWSRPRWLLGRD